MRNQLALLFPSFRSSPLASSGRLLRFWFLLALRVLRLAPDNHPIVSNLSIRRDVFVLLGHRFPRAIRRLRLTLDIRKHLVGLALHAIPGSTASAPPPAKLFETLHSRRGLAIDKPASLADQRQTVPRERLVLAKQDIQEPVIPAGTLVILRSCGESIRCKARFINGRRRSRESVLLEIAVRLRDGFAAEGGVDRGRLVRRTSDIGRRRRCDPCSPCHLRCASFAFGFLPLRISAALGWSSLLRLSAIFLEKLLRRVVLGSDLQFLDRLIALLVELVQLVLCFGDPILEKLARHRSNRVDSGHNS